MKKVVFAIIVLVAIIVFGTLSLGYYKNSSQQISKMIEDVSDNIASEKWDKAAEQIGRIEETWNGTERSWTMLIDHFEVDNIEMSLKKSKKYVENKDKALSLAEIETLKFIVEHIYHKEAFELNNIL